MAHRRTKPALRRFAVILLLAVAATLGLLATAAAQWTDLTGSVLQQYQVTEPQLRGISQGYPDGSWRPYAPMLRRHFIKMAVQTFVIPLGTPPASPSFTDVPLDDPDSAYVEAGVRAGLTEGVGDHRYAPDGEITREQAVAMISRWRAEERGQDLEALYTESEAYAALARFSDAAEVGPELVREMAFAVDNEVVRGSGDGLLKPKDQVSRVQGAAMLIRSAQNSSSTTTKTQPTTTTSSSTTTTNTTVPSGPRIHGRVLGGDGIAVASATVMVLRNAGDPGYVPGGNNVLGHAATDGGGHYSISLQGIALGTLVVVTARADGYLSVLQYGAYDTSEKRVDFDDFGSAGGDRRLPLDEGQMPPFPFEGLLPG